MDVKKHKILIVEDNTIVAKTTKLILESLGCQRQNGPN